MLDKINDFFINFFSQLALPRPKMSDVVEILILAIIVYNIIKWVKRTRAWIIVKGLCVLLLAWIVAYLLGFNVILWIFANTITVGITALIILFQPEFRKALEQLGQRNVMSTFGVLRDVEHERFSDKTLDELVTATFDLARNKTGALIVVEQEVSLADFERTGIAIDAITTSQLLINIFEHNTPLHDGAVIIRGNRITSATCYLPLSDNMRLSKELGTRHRAGIGISEVTDSFTIIVSEETGKVSVAHKGEIHRHISMDVLRKKLVVVQNKTVETKKLFGFVRNIVQRKKGENTASARRSK